MHNKQTLLIISPGNIPTVEIIKRSLDFLQKDYRIKIVLEHRLPMRYIFSGEYKLLFMRQCSPNLQPLLKMMQQFNISYLYYLDDNFWEIKSDSPLGELYQDETVKKTLTDFISGASCVITGSNYLKDYVKKFNKQVVYIKPAFSFDLIKNSQQHPKSNLIKILYSGSLYRDADFQFVIPALKKILNDYAGKIKIYFHGYVPESLKNFSDVIYDENFYPYEDYIKKQYQENYSIGLAPLTPSLSNYSKTNLKYREYGACQIAGIYSAQPPYTDCVINNKTGLLVNATEQDWYQAIKLLIDNESTYIFAHYVLLMCFA